MGPADRQEAALQKDASAALDEALSIISESRKLRCGIGCSCSQQAQSNCCRFILRPAWLSGRQEAAPHGELSPPVLHLSC
jgi:hypothetical protein